ncbi:MAG: phosphoglycerate dehydrogenase [Erysipelothrix sp.]|nr:phosphoglycerate dehydrogenase [Erysipelothrix sp.]
MYHIQTFNHIAQEGLNLFDQRYSINVSENPDAIILRSHILKNHTFSPNLKAIARAGVGINNIPVDKATENGVVVFNTPGANANAVKEMVIAGMLLSSRPILQSHLWLKTLESKNLEKEVENHKSQFKGYELEGKTLGVIGLGNIGSMVANDAYRLGMNVIGYDPYVSVHTAWNISRRVKRALSLDEILHESDIISIHIPLNQDTKNYISTSEIKKMKEGVILLNFSRRELIDKDALLKALNTHHIKNYVTDFPDQDLLKIKNVLTFPHLGASTFEAELNCAKAAVRTLIHFLETGNIINSVNFPDMELTFNSSTRFTIIHKNIPKMLGRISNIAGKFNVNIENMMNRNSGEYAYTIVDIKEQQPETIYNLNDALSKIDGVIKTRIIHNSK